MVESTSASLCVDKWENYEKIYFHLENLNRSLALYSSHYGNFIVTGDFNVKANDSAISVFSNTYDLKILIKEPTFWKNSNDTSYIDLVFANKPRTFKHSCVIKTDLLDFHKMTIVIMETFREKLQPRVVGYRDYRYFENDRLRTDLLSELCKVNIKEKEMH